MNIAAFILFSALSSVTFGQGLATDCQRVKQPQGSLIYLHGIDTASPGPQELQNRKMLRDLAIEKNWNLAIVRSDSKCDQHGMKLCWTHSPKAKAQSAWNAIQKATRTCRVEKSPTTYLGFSNGGYLLAKVFQQCLASHTDWFVLVGAAGTIQGAPNPCGFATIAFGKRDITRTKAIDLFKRLYPVTTRLRLVEFEGGHELNADLFKRVF